MLSAREHDIRRAGLMDGAIHAVAINGLENTATRDISIASGINEAYIYRYFENKEDLLAKTFAREDDLFLEKILNNFPVLHYESIEYEARCKVLFMRCWEYIIGRREQLTFYIRYYYSSSFLKYAYEEHMQKYEVLLENMKNAFPESVDSRAILNHILDTLLNTAMNQLNHPNRTNEEAAENNFRMIFSVVKAFVKNGKADS